MTITYSPLPSVLGLSPHGILGAIGVLAAFALLARETRRRDLPIIVIERAVLWGVLAAIVGARLDYVISHPGQFDSISQVLALWNGGMALFGGLIGGFAVGLPIAFRGGAHLPRLMDAAAPAVALGVVIGRVGDLLLTDHLGKPYTGGFGLGYRVPLGANLAPGFGPSPAVAPPPGVSCTDLGQFYAGCAYHLTPAYDLVGALLLFVLLMALRRWVAYRSGVAISLWATWYGTQRLIMDFTRGIDERLLFGLTGTQLLSIGVLAAGLVSLAAIALRGSGWGDEPGDRSSRQAPLSRGPAHVE